MAVRRQFILWGVCSALLGLLLNCGSPTLPTVPASPTRRPPGLVADPPFSPPPPRAVADADVAIVSLAAPHGKDSVLALLGRFFRAVTSESNAQLSRVMTGNAIAVFPNTTGTSAIGSWSRRFAAFDYRELETVDLFTGEDVSTYDAQDVVRLRGVREFHLDPADDELLAVVPLRSAPTELLGSHMQFLLIHGADGYRIRATYEDFVPR